MKAFLGWLAITLTAFGGLAGGYHVMLENSPHKILVVVDSSFAMKADWSRVSYVLSRIDDRRYSRFALATEKGPVHGYRGRLDAGRLTPYAPRDFSRLAELDAVPELVGAGERILVTNAPDSEIAQLGDWLVIRP